ncbi:MAG: hypothetical protein R3B48_29925 [Kofleriaceae bacterium]
MLSDIQNHRQDTLESFKACVARRLQMEPAKLYNKSMKLSEIVARSPTASNSIDLMEAVAGAMAELEIDDRVELPAITLQHTVDQLIDEVRAQLAVNGIA